VPRAINLHLDRLGYQGFWREQRDDDQGKKDFFHGNDPSLKF